MIDPQALATYFGGDTALLRKFAAMFVQEAPKIVNLMDEALTSGDLPAMAIHAHTLKSQIKYFGFPELVEQAQEMEHLAEAGVASERLSALFAIFNRGFMAAYSAVAALGAE